MATLLEIIASLQPGDRKSPTQVADELNAPGSKGLVDLKDRATDTVNQALAPIQAELERVHLDPDFLDCVALHGAQQAQVRASDTMRQVKSALGIL